jgi:sigma-B regulation protein RsbQ
MLFAHGYGCDQNMWRHVAPAFEDEYRVVLFDHVGAGHSDITAYDREKYSSLEGYATDILEIVEALDLTETVYVGHSVAGMMGVIAAKRRPEIFGNLVLVGPSARYIDDGDYLGGFTHDQIDDLLVSLESNFLGWSSQMAPLIMANGDRPQLGEELTNSFCRMDPDIARQFADVTFTSDNRADLADVDVPVLVMQCSADVIAPEPVGWFVHESIPNSTFVKLEATGHCPNLSAPQETIEAIKAYL